jgi:hypothetical protein
MSGIRKGTESLQWVAFEENFLEETSSRNNGELGLGLSIALPASKSSDSLRQLSPSRMISREF